MIGFAVFRWSGLGKAWPLGVRVHDMCSPCFVGANSVRRGPWGSGFMIGFAVLRGSGLGIIIGTGTSLEVHQLIYIQNKCILYAQPLTVYYKVSH